LSSRPGILADIAERTASKGLSIENISTKLRLGKGGKREFVVKALVSSTRLSDKENLDAFIAELALLKADIQLSTLDIRVQIAKN
jgi:hypothetical protein